MYQRDYILRMIEMIGELIAGILGLIRKGKFDQASEAIAEIYREMLKEDASFFSSIPAEQLTNQLLNEHNYTNGHLEILGELFYAQAELSLAQNDYEESLQYYRKSLILFNYVTTGTAVFSLEKQARKEKIREQIELLEERTQNT